MNIMFLISGLACFGIGIVVLILSILASKKHVAKNNRCTAVVEGTVTRFEKKEFVESDRDGSNSYIESYYYPVYEYVVDNQSFEVRSSSGKRNPDVALIGQKKPICYNPDNCAECYIVGEDFKIAYKIAKILGIVFLIIGVISVALFFTLGKLF